MNPIPSHLTSGQLESLLTRPNDAAPDTNVQAHLHACPACSEEFATLRSCFADLRLASHAAAAHLQQQPNRRAQPSSTQRRFQWPRFTYAYAATAATCVVGLSLALHLHTATAVRPSPHPGASVTAITTQHPATSTTSLSDDQLLSSIQSDLAASVPAPLAPLESANSSSSNTLTTQENQ